MKPIDMRNHSTPSKKKHRKGSGDSSAGDSKEAQDTTRALETSKDPSEVAGSRNAGELVDSADAGKPAASIDAREGSR